MSAGTPPVRAVLPWVGFGLALALATASAWRIPLLGFHPTLDELLSLRCLPLP